MLRVMRLQLWPYSMAISVAALAILLTLPLWSLIQPNIYPLFLTAVILSARIGGLGFGLLAIILSTLSIAYFLILPVEELHPSRGRVEGRLERISRQPHIEVSHTDKGAIPTFFSMSLLAFPRKTVLRQEH